MSPTEQQTVVLAGRVFDGTSSLEGPQTITLTGSEITHVRQGIDHDIAPGTRVLDHSRHTVLPGLIDAHVHLTMRGDGTTADIATDRPSGELTAIAAGSAQAALRHGITTLRDTGSPGPSVFDLRHAAGGDLVLPRLIVCGPPVTITGGHCWFMGGEADGVDGLRAKVRQLARDGADWIKVMATGGGTRGSYPWLPSFTQAELDAIVDEAHRRNRKVTAHCLSAVGIEMSVTAGVDQIEHGGFATDAHGGAHFTASTASRMRDANVAVTPTLSVRKFIRDQALLDGTDRAESRAIAEHWKQRLDNGMEQFRGLLSHGVRPIAGTDAGWHRSPFDALPTELALMVECGMSTVDALRSATSASADHFGLGAEVGRIAPGMRADLAIVDGDPVADIEALHRVVQAVSGGALVEPVIAS